MNTLCKLDVDTRRVDGEIEILVEKDGQNTVKLKNIVTDMAVELKRDFIFGDDLTMRLNVGDIGYGDESDWDNVPPAVGDEDYLINKLAGIPHVSKEKVIYNSRVAIKYTFIMDKEDYNGLTDPISNETKFVELGLAVDDDRLFTKKNHSVILKDQYTKITITYYLMF